MFMDSINLLTAVPAETVVPVEMAGVEVKADNHEGVADPEATARGAGIAPSAVVGRRPREDSQVT